MLSLILKGIKDKKGESFFCFLFPYEYQIQHMTRKGNITGNNITSGIKDKK